MLTSQLFTGLEFYLIFSLFAFIGMFFAGRIFSGRVLSYVIAKPIGLVIFAYLVWLLGFFHILDYQWVSMIWILLGVLSVVALYLSRQSWKALVPSWKKLLCVEGLTLLVYVLYLMLRSHNATSSNGAESFMDMTLLSAASKTDFFPFLDSWYAGKTINYYYYGSYLMSLLGNLGSIPYYLSYNFSLGLIYCQSILLVAALIYALTRSKAMSFLGAFLATSAGTLFYASCTVKALLAAGKTCSYATSTRLYTPSYIINEIPSYSFTVGDLHAHLLALPFFILNLIILFALSKNAKPTIFLLGTFALTLATSGMINAWDGITLASLFAILSAINYFRSSKRWAIYGVSVLAATLLFMSPALATFQSPVLGLGFAPTYVVAHQLSNVQYPTPLLAVLGMWGIFIAGLAVSFIFRKKFSEHSLFISSLCIVSVGIIVGVELFFIKDIYSVSNAPYFRANTTFKFGYHAWTMLSIAFAAVLGQWIFPQAKREKQSWKIVPIAFVVVAVCAGFYYPYQALNQYYAPNRIQQSLDASQWLLRSAPDDYNAVQFINANIHYRAIIAEAVGDSYTTFGRISALTGMIAPMGWKTHEWTWRFQGKAAENAPKGTTIETGYGPIAIVADEIRELYMTSNVQKASELLKKYKIEYVFVGTLERGTYQNLDEAKFAKLGKMIFQAGDAKLYKIEN